MGKTKQVSTIPKGFTMKWSTQQISYTIQSVLLGYITYYCTNSLGLGAAITGVILMASKIFDGFTDIIAGIVIERVHTRFGKGRPFVLLMPVSWLLTILLFTVQPAGTVGKAAFLFVVYFMICSVCNTLVQAAEPVYLARSLKNPGDSATVLSYSTLILAVVSILVSVAFPFLITGFGSRPHGWSIIAVLLGIPCMFLSFFRFLTVKERTDIAAGEDGIANAHKFGLKDAWQVLVNSKGVFLLVLILIIFNMNTATTFTYYFQYVIGDINQQAIVTAMIVLGMIPLAFAGKAFKRFSKKQILIFAALMGVLGSCLRAIPNVPVWCVASAICGFAALPAGVIIPALLIDCMDSYEYNTGKRVEGVFGALNSLPPKVGQAFAAGMTGIVLGIGGFDGALEVQSKQAITAISATCSWIPAIFFAIIAILSFIYKGDRGMEEIRAELDRRRALAAEQPQKTRE